MSPPTRAEKDTRRKLRLTIEKINETQSEIRIMADQLQMKLDKIQERVRMLQQLAVIGHCHRKK